MKRRFAIPIYEGKLSEHFGHCEAFAFIDSHDNRISNIATVVAPAHQPGSYPRWLAENGVSDVIAGGIGTQAMTIFNGLGINVYIGAQREYPKELVEQFLSHGLKTGSNVCDHDQREHTCKH